jgi:hypothetical protein
MVALLVISLQQHIPFPNICAPTPQHSICVCITFHQVPTLVVHRGQGVSVALTEMVERTHWIRVSCDTPGVLHFSAT